jgi:hypothetical protein
MKYIAGLLILGGLTTVWAQDHDFLTSDEIDQVRLTQEPNARLKLYLKFAQERVAMIQQLLTRNKPDRAILIHDTLGNYEKIIEAIDTVGDDALGRKISVEEGMKAVAPAERKMSEELKKIADAPPKDYEIYEFALSQAIETTDDSADLSGGDLGKRAAEVQSRDQKQRSELESLMSPEEKAAAKKQDKTAEAKKTTKAPTLLRPGEKLKKTDQ